MKIREDEHGPTHCAECKTEFGAKHLIGEFFGVKVYGSVCYASYQGSVLCEACEEEAIAEGLMYS